MVLAVSGPRRVAAPTRRRNVGDAERLASAIGGGAMALAGLRRSGLSGLALAAIGGALVYRGVTGHSQIYERLGLSTHHDEGDDVTGAAATVNARRAVKVEEAVTISAPRAGLYAFWRDFGNHPRFMSHVLSVRPQVDGSSRYELELPGGKAICWTSEIVRDIPGELIAWKTVEPSDIAHAGSVHFRDTDDGLGTVVTLAMDYEPIGGRPGQVLAKLFGVAPEQLVRADLDAFRRLMEART